ncbi:hypothetical protein [Algibacter luteus]|uniref:hypothetical protein n=1 Tax=Algibacter luteus TaxID=1178825 RepID=UPI0025987832|nr:hypothetical protein [Algibacter luteus]WJJ98119.1 hypothetical protein O5O44_06945 [Algibacter luteus]
MHRIKEHIIFRLLKFLLVIALMVPSTIKLIHVFEHHEHEICVGGDTTHIHKIDLDCEFQKFQLTTHFNLPDVDFAVFQPKKISTSIESQYFFLSKYQRLHFSLRGPPSLV